MIAIITMQSVDGDCPSTMILEGNEKTMEISTKKEFRIVALPDEKEKKKEPIEPTDKRDTSYDEYV